MSKPRLLVLQGKRNFRVPTYVESPTVRGHFDVRKATSFKVRKGRVSPDLIYCQAYGPFHELLGKCRKWGVPYVIHVGGSPWFEMKGERLRRTVKTMRNAKAVVCNSKFLHREFLKNMTPDAGNLRTLPDGLWGLDHTPLGPSPSRFRPKEDYSYSGRPVVIMSMSLKYDDVHRSKWRGVEILFDAIKGLNTPHGKPVFVCAGRNDKDFPLIGRWNKACEIHVRSSHHLDEDKDEWPDVLRGADLFVHPSMQDCWPRVMGDAMCAAVPCLVFDTTGSPEVGKSVVLVDPDDPNVIRDKFEALLTDESLRETVGRRVRDEALRRTVEHREDYVKLLLEVLR